MVATPDAVEQAFRDAPTAEHQESPEERAMVHAARIEYERGGITLDAAQVTALLRVRSEFVRPSAKAPRT